MLENSDFVFYEDMQAESNLNADNTDNTDNLVRPVICNKWKIMIVDDEYEVHRITKLVLNRFEFEGKGLEFVSAYSAKEAKELLYIHSDVALVLLDVVMEEDDSGLQLVKFIREEVGNKLVRIVLRTGQPGQAPEDKVILNYDINDYKDKTELTSQKLFSEVVSSLRSYRDVSTIESNRLGLKKIINSYNYIFDIDSIKNFTRAVLNELAGILDSNYENCNKSISGFSVVIDNDKYYIVSAIGRFVGLENRYTFDVLPNNIINDLKTAQNLCGNLYRDNSLVLFMSNKNGTESLIYIEDSKKLNILNKGLVEVFCKNISAVNESIISKSRYEVEKQQRKFTETLYNLNQNLTSTFDLKEVLNRLLYSIKESINCDVINLVLKINDKYLLATEDINEYAKSYYIDTNCIEYKIMSNLHTNKRSILLGDVNNSWLTQNTIENCDKMNSLLAIPIVYNDELLGAILLWKTEFNSFKRREKEIIETYISQAGIAIANAKLYTEVTNQRSYVKNLLNNAGQGFLSFGYNLLIDQEYSCECEKIFNKKLDGIKISDILFNDGKERSFWEDALKSIFREKSNIKRKIMMSLLDKELYINKRCIGLEYKMIKHGDMEKIMIILTDVTDKRKLEKDIETERKILQMIVNVIKHHNDFINTIRDFEIFSSTTVFEALNSDKSFDRVFSHILRNIHTYKGIFGQLGIVSTTMKLQDLEEQMCNLKNRNIIATKEKLKDFIQKCELESILKKDLDILCNILGKKFVYDDKIINIQQSNLIDIERKIAMINDDNYKDILKDIKYLRYRPFKELLSTYPKYSMDLSERLEKLLKPFEIIGGEFLVSTDIYDRFCKSLVHVFRNAIDHGIEEYEERIKTTKEESATISCEVKLVNDKIVITIKDDGRGLDISKIKLKALSMNIINQEELQFLGENEIMKFILRDELSTCKQITDLSGRGYGLSAVNNQIDKLDGKIEIQSVIGKGTSFTFTLPYRE